MTTNEFNALPAVITTERMVMRETTLNDAHSLFRIWSQKNVAKFMNIEAFTSISQAEEIILEIIDEKYACRYTILLTGKIIGSIGINETNPTAATCEIGYELAESYWQQGIMTEVLQTFLNEIKKTRHYRGVTAKTMAANIASIHLLQKLKFIPQKKYKEYDFFSQKICDMIIYQLLFSS